MLKPSSDRLNFSDLLIPPDGYQADFALGTTYSLSLEALVGLPLALFLSEEMSGNLLDNPVVALEGLRRSADRFLLLCQGGQILVPQNHSLVVSLLEDSVFEVTLSKEKSFHPKIWLVRYLNDMGDPLYRLLVMSRNMTFDRSWDMAVCLEGAPAKPEEIQEVSIKNAPLISFVEYLNQKVKKRKKTLILSQIQQELLSIRFETNDPHFGDFSFHPMGIPGYTKRPQRLFDTYKDLLIISPFLSRSMVQKFNQLALSNATRTLITRRSEVGKLTPELMDSIDVFAMKELIVEGEETLSGDEDRQTVFYNQDIHAKFYARYKYSGRHKYDSTSFFVGSANCSSNGFSGNIEFLLELQYFKWGFRIEDLLVDLFGKEEKDNPFEHITELPAEEDNDMNEEAELEQAIYQLSRSRSKGVVSENNGYYQITLQFSKVPEEVDLMISAIHGHQTMPVRSVTVLSPLNLEQLGEFYQVTASKGQGSIQRILKIPTQGIPEERDKAIFRSVINNRETFMKYVAFLLTDNALLSRIEQLEQERIGKGHWNMSWLQSPALYENMLKMVASHPSRLKEVERVMQLIDDPEIIPEEFNSLYQVFLEASKKVKK